MSGQQRHGDAGSGEEATTAQLEAARRMLVTARELIASPSSWTRASWARDAKGGEVERPS